MKKLLYIVPLLLGMALTSCYDEDIEKINSRLDAIENTQIATISQQITSINNSIQLLTDTDTELKGYIATLEKDVEQSKADIEALKAKDSAIEKLIAELRSYVDSELKSAQDWATATFATLEQHNALATELASLKTYVEGVESSLNNAISALKISMKEWVNEQLTGYYTIAQMDAKLEALQNSLTEGDGALQKEIDTLRKSLAAQKTELTEAYTTAITEAINANNGVIDAKIASAIGKVNEQIAGLEERINTLEERITKLEGTMSEVQEQVAALVARIQSISYIPRYSDGKASIDKTKKIGVFEFQISPKDAVAELEKVWQSALTMQAVHTQTRAVSFIEFPVTYFDADTENGTFLIEVDAANLGDQFFSGDIEASASLHISDGNNNRTSEYINLVVGEVESLTNNTPPANEIWYTNGSTTEPTTPNKTDVFGAIYVSNTYDAKKGCWVIKFDGDVTSIGERAFCDCTALTSISIPDGVTEIGRSAFKNCSSLASVTIPDSVIEIGDYAFQYCASLTSVTIPDGVTEIGISAFYACSSLTSFYGKFASDDNRCLIIDGVLNSFTPAGLTAYTIPNGVTSIGDYAFQYCTSLTSITIPDSVTSIGNYAFRKCSSLTSISIPDGVTEIGVQAFKNCSSLASVTIPDSVTSIRIAAFSYCSSLTSFHGKFASEDGKCLIVDNVLKAFAIGCNLAEYTIPNSVTEIGVQAFCECSSLTSIIIPDSVTKIGVSAFNNCTSLASVYCKPTTPSSGNSNMFYNNAWGRKIYVPTESVNAYKSATYWSDYADSIYGYDF